MATRTTMEKKPLSPSASKVQRHLLAIENQVDALPEVLEAAPLSKKSQQILAAVIEKLQRICSGHADEEEGLPEGAENMIPTNRRTLAKLYIPWGRIVECPDGDDGAVKVEIDESPDWMGEVREAIESVNEDIRQEIVEFVDSRGLMHRISRPIDRDAVEALGTAIEGRTHGHVMVLPDVNDLLAHATGDQREP